MEIMDYNLKYIYITIALVSLLFFETNSNAELCRKWSEAQRVGSLDQDLINEASGVEASKQYPERLYHINDSGGGHFFYTTDIKGNQTRKIKIEGEEINRSDFEALSVGKCLDNSCLYIGDIGDNLSTKPYVEIIVVQELEKYGASVKPLHRIKLTYPDQPHNAEAMAVHPNGDIYIITKEENLRNLEAYPAKVFKLPAEKWQPGSDKKLTLQYIGEIDFRLINPSGTAYGQVVSSLDIAPDGKSFLVLTYENALEFNIDLSKDKIKSTSQLKKGIDYNMIEIKSLPQQESITYVPNEKSFLYNTEFHWFTAPIMKVDCKE